MINVLTGSGAEALKNPEVRKSLDQLFDNLVKEQWLPTSDESNWNEVIGFGFSDGYSQAQAGIQPPSIDNSSPNWVSIKTSDTYEILISKAPEKFGSSYKARSKDGDVLTIYSFNGETAEYSEQKERINPQGGSNLISSISYITIGATGNGSHDVVEVIADPNGDRVVDTHNLIFGTGTGSASYNLNNAAQRQDAEYLLNGLHDDGLVTDTYWNTFTRNSADQLINSGNTWEPPTNSPMDFWFSDPIGAFYDSQSTAYDNAASIARKTGVLVDTNNTKVTVAQLAALDANHDGQLGTAEAASLRFWQDANEDGRRDAGETVTVSQNVASADYVFYTQGNAKTLALLTPTLAAMPDSALPVAPSKVDTTQAVPASNYRILRNTDNMFPMFTS